MTHESPLPPDFSFQLDEFYLDLQQDGSKISLLTQEYISGKPFPGLRPFRTSEFQLFKGRSGQAEELIKRLKKNQFLAVIGSSGTGKSSLIRAGLIPQLFGGYLHEAGNKWNIAICRPGKNPIENLAIALSSLKSHSKERDSILEEYKIIAPLLDNSIYGILDIKELLNRSEGNSSNLLIIIDQFEELFRFDRTDLKKENIESHFVNLLLKAALNPGSSIYVITTMRSEFLGNCVKYRGLPEAINEGQYLVPQLNRNQLKEVIEGPIKLAGKRISPGLVEFLINEIEETNLKENLDQLPILQHALMCTYNEAMKHGSDVEIIYDHYEKIGGMQNALANHANNKYEELKEDNINQNPSKAQLIAKILFQALTDLDSDEKGGRRPTELKNIYAIAECINANKDEVNRVVNHFRQQDTSFIMPPISTLLYPDLMLDISHESLMRNWDKLKKWIEEEVKNSRLYKILDERRILNENDSDQWLRGILLKELLDWEKDVPKNAAWAMRYDSKKENYKENYSKNISFLNESKSKVESEIRKKERKKKSAIVLLTSALLVSSVIAVFAFNYAKKISDMYNTDTGLKKANLYYKLTARDWWNNDLDSNTKYQIRDTLFKYYVTSNHQDSLKAELFENSMQTLKEAKDNRGDFASYLYLVKEAEKTNDNFVSGKLYNSLLKNTMPYERKIEFPNSDFFDYSDEYPLVVRFLPNSSNEFILGCDDTVYIHHKNEDSLKQLLSLDFGDVIMSISNDCSKFLCYNQYSNSLVVHEFENNFHEKKRIVTNILKQSKFFDSKKIYQENTSYPSLYKYGSNNRSTEIYNAHANFSPDNRFLAVRLGTKSLSIYNTINTLIRNFPYRGQLKNFCFNQSGNELLLCFSDSIVVLNTGSFKENNITFKNLAEYNNADTIIDAKFEKNDNIRLLFNSKIIEFNSNDMKNRNLIRIATSFDQIFSPLSFSYYLTYNSNDQNPQINILDKNLKFEKGFPWHDGNLINLDFSSDGKEIISVGPDDIYLWNMDTIFQINDKLIDQYAAKSDLPNKYCDNGINYYSNKKYDSAIYFLHKSVNINPRYASACNYLGLVYFDKGNYDTAIQHFQKASASDPNNLIYRNNIGNALRKSKKYDEALNVLNQSLKMDSSNADTWNYLGLVHEDQHKYAIAIQYYRKASSLDLNDMTYLNNLGYVLRKSKKYDEAIQVLNQSLKTDSTNADTWVYLGLVYEDQNKYSTAVQNYRKASLLDLKNVAYLNNMGDEFRELKKYDEAAKVLYESLEIDSLNADTWNYLGLVYDDQNKYAIAIQYYRKASSLDLKDAIYLYNLGVALRKSKKYNEAIKPLNQSLEIDSLDADTWNQLGYLYYILDEAVKSEQFCRKAIFLDSTKSLYWNNLANVLANKGFYDSALTLYKKAVTLSPKDAHIFGNIARTYLRAKNYKAALNYSNISINLDSTYSPAYAYKGFSNLKLGNINQGMNFLNKAIEIDSSDYRSYYLLAAYYSHTNNQPLAIKYLDSAITKGFIYPGVILEENWFDNLNGNSAFSQIKNSLNTDAVKRRKSIENY
jgi:tetratricopeptide (TPR) repeat protein